MMMPVQGFGRVSLLEDLFVSSTMDEIRNSGIPPVDFFKRVGLDGRESLASWLEGIRTAAEFGDSEALEEYSRELGLPVDVLEKFDENRGLIKRVLKILMKDEERFKEYFRKALGQPEFALERFWLRIEENEIRMRPYNFGIVPRETYGIGKGYYAIKDYFGRLLIYKYGDFRFFKVGNDELVAVIDPYRRVVVTDRYEEVKGIAEKLGISSWEISRFLVSMGEYRTSIKDFYVRVDGKYVSLDTLIKSDERNRLVEEIRKRLSKYSLEQLERDYLLLRYEVNKAMESVSRGNSGIPRNVGKVLMLLVLGMVGLESIGALRGYLVGKLHQRLKNDVKIKSYGGNNPFKYMDDSELKYLKQSGEGIGILANDIDWNLNYQRISSELSFGKIPYVRVNSSADFGKISNLSKLLILGGHLAPGISKVTSQLLNATEKYLLINNPNRVFVFIKKDVYKPGQTVVIVAGKTRRETSFGTLDRDSNYTPDGLQPLIDRDGDGLPVSFDPNDNEGNLESKSDIGKVRSYVVFAKGRGKGIDGIRGNLGWLFYNCSFTSKLLSSFKSEDYPDAGLYVLLDIVRKAIASYVNDYGNMAIAMSVVWDYPVKNFPSLVNYDTYLADLAKFFVDINEKRETKFDLKELNVEELVCVVDTMYVPYTYFYPQTHYIVSTDKNMIITPIGDLEALHKKYRGKLSENVRSILEFAYRKVYNGGKPKTPPPYPTPLKIDEMKVSCVPTNYYVRTVGQVLGIPTKRVDDSAINHVITPYWDGSKWMYGIGYWRLKNPIPENELYTYNWDDGYHWGPWKVYLTEFDPWAFWWFEKLKK